MALSGVFSTSVSGGHYRSKAVWRAVQNVVNNTSTITVDLYLDTDYSLYVGTRNASIIIDGQTFSFTAPKISTGTASSTLLGSATKTITHNGDGAKSISMSAYYAIQATISGTYYGSMTTSSGTVALDTIPRASPITTFANFVIGDSITIALDRKVDTFTHTLTLKVGSTVVATRTGIGASTTIVLSTAEQDKIYNAIPKDVNATVTLFCDTYSGSTKIGATQSKTATATVGASIIPSFTSITAEENNTNVASIVGKFVQNLSSIKFSINGASGVKGSTIAGYRISFNGVSRDVPTIIFDNINKNGDMVATATVTDSRGRTASKTLTINLLPYSMPKITAFALHRCNADGTDNALGTYVKVTSVGSVVSLLNSTEKNNLTYKIYSKPRVATTWVEKKSLVVVGLNLNATDTIGTYDATASFDFRLDVTDKFNTTLSLNVLSTGKVTMSWGIEGIGVGKIWERGALDVGGDAYADNYYEGGVKLADKYLGKTEKAVDSNLLNGLDSSAFDKKSEWVKSSALNGYVKLPNGIIIQWGTVTVTVSTANAWSTHLANFPITFPVTCFCVVLNTDSSGSGVPYSQTSHGYITTSKTSIYVKAEGTGNVTIRYIAIGC